LATAAGRFSASVAVHNTIYETICRLQEIEKLILPKKSKKNNIMKFLPNVCKLQKMKAILVEGKATISIF